MSFAEKYVLIEYRVQNQYNKVHVWTHETILVPLRDEYINLTIEFWRKKYIAFNYWYYKQNYKWELIELLIKLLKHMLVRWLGLKYNICVHFLVHLLYY